MNTLSKLLRLLVVDDEQHLLDAFRRSFRKDFDMVLANSADQALNMLKAGEFDVLIVDYAMPGTNGLELLRAISELRPRMTRILVTAHYDLPEVQVALRQGLAGKLIPKPWSREEILLRLS